MTAINQPAEPQRVTPAAPYYPAPPVTAWRSVPKLVRFAVWVWALSVVVGVVVGVVIGVAVLANS